MSETAYQCINAYNAVNGSDNHPDCHSGCPYNWNHQSIPVFSDVITSSVFLLCPIFNRRVAGITYTFSDEQVHILERLAIQFKLYDRRN